MIKAFESAIIQVQDEPGVELYALHEAPDRLIMIEKYESEHVRQQHTQRPALADLLSALDGRLTSRLQAVVLQPHPYGRPDKGAV